jgi:hypothetical protein
MGRRPGSRTGTMRKTGPPAWINPACAASAFLIPFWIAVAHTGSTPHWRDDLPVIRGLGWAATGWDGAVSTVLIQIAVLLPIGSVTFRAALVAAMASGACGMAVYALCRGLVNRSAVAPWLNAAASVVAALSATLLGLGLREATVGGGASVAVLLGIGALYLAREERWADARGLAAAGAVLGAACAESPACGMSVVVALLVQRIASRRLPAVRFAAVVLGFGIVTAALLWLPLCVRPFAPNLFRTLGPAVNGLRGPVSDLVSFDKAGVFVWLREVGPVALVLSGCGALLGLYRSRLRSATVALVSVVVFDALICLPRWNLPAERLAASNLLSVSALAIGTALAVQTVSTLLFSAQIRMARGAAVLLVMFDLTMAMTSAEEASFAEDAAADRGAEAFSDEGLDRLAPGAMVLLRSRVLALRLWASQIAYGARPDVLVVATPMLGDGRSAAGLLRAEPAAQGVLRDLSLDGHAGEQALTVLADLRPLELELDPGYDRRLISHMVADHLWLRFFPHPLGASDRRIAFSGVQPRLADLIEKTRIGERTDAHTLAVAKARLRDQATASAALGDRPEAIALLGELEKLAGADLFVVELMQRLAATKAGPVDTKGLLR